MTSHTRRTTRVAVAVASAAVAALVAVPAAAFAAPVANNDRYPMYAGGTYTIDPLTNDDTTVLSPEALSLCGISGVDWQRVYVERSGNSIVVEVRGDFRGRASITYEACQGNQRDSAVIIIDVARLADLKGVKKENTRGKVLFTNSNNVAINVTYGSASSGRSDASRTVPAGRSITVGTTRRSLYWVGLLSDDGVVINLGDETIYRVQTMATKN